MMNENNVAEGIRNIDLIRIHAQSKEDRILATSTFPYSFYYLTRYYLHIGLTRRYKTFCSKYHRNGIISDLCVICHKTKIGLINMSRRSGGGGRIRLCDSSPYSFDFAIPRTQSPPYYTVVLVFRQFIDSSWTDKIVFRQKG